MSDDFADPPTRRLRNLGGAEASPAATLSRMQVEQHLAGAPRGGRRVRHLGDDGGARGTRSDHARLGRTPPGRAPGSRPPLGDGTAARGNGWTRTRSSAKGWTPRTRSPGFDSARTGSSRRSGPRPTSPRRWPSRPTLPDAEAVLGHGGSATRRRSMPWTRCRPSSAATPVPPTPGSVPTSPWTASTSCSPASCRGRTRTCAPTTR